MSRISLIRTSRYRPSDIGYEKEGKWFMRREAAKRDRLDLEDALADFYDGESQCDSPSSQIARSSGLPIAGEGDARGLV